MSRRSYVTRRPAELTPAQRRLVERARRAHERYLAAPLDQRRVTARRRAVAEAHEGGAPFAALGEALGITRQSAHRIARAAADDA